MSERICSVDGCARPTQARGFCGMHYYRWSKHGDPGGAEKLRPGRAGIDADSCAIEGCDQPRKLRRSNGRVYRSSLCVLHEGRKERRGDPLAEVRPWNDAAQTTGGYQAVHAKLAKHRGRASEHPCVHCGVTAAQWAYTYDAPDEDVAIENGVPVRFSRQTRYYMPLCGPCHRRFDNAHKV